MQEIYSTLDKIVLGPQHAQFCVIWLHGLGADGNDFVPLIPELQLPEALVVRFVFPHAPLRPVTLNGGAVMRAWYDINALGGRHREDEVGIREAECQLQALIHEQMALGVPANHIVLAGFSQGGALALQTGLRFGEPLGGILALSTYLPLVRALAREKSAANQSIPIWMAHGLWDNIIPLQTAESSAEVLKTLGYSVSWHTYPMEHQVCPDEIAAISRWLQALYKRLQSDL